MTGARRTADPPTLAADRRPADALRLLAVVTLVVNAYVHLRLAPVFDQLGTQITQGMLFRLEALAAGLGALLLAVSDRRTAWALAGLIQAAALGAVLGTHYLRVPALGPFPAMHDPAWSADKVAVVIVTTVGVLAWGARMALRR